MCIMLEASLVLFAAAATATAVQIPSGLRVMQQHLGRYTTACLKFGCKCCMLRQNTTSTTAASASLAARQMTTVSLAAEAPGDVTLHHLHAV
jgi:hypothetical protein